MRKVYLVIEEYRFEGCNDTNVNTFETKEKAKEEFNKIVERELTESWVSDLIIDEDDELYEYNKLEQNECDFYAYDSDDDNETSIRIVEKEIQ